MRQQIEPEYLYLGRDDLMDLKESCDPRYMLELFTDPLTFMGCKIYEVNEARHFQMFGAAVISEWAPESSKVKA